MFSIQTVGSKTKNNFIILRHKLFIQFASNKAKIVD